MYVSPSKGTVCILNILGQAQIDVGQYLMKLWNAETATFRDLRRSRNYIIVDDRCEWYEVPICAPLPSASTITIPPRISHLKDSNSIGPSDGNLPPVRKHLRDKSTSMTPPMSLISKRSFSLLDDGRTSSSDYLLMQPTAFLLLPSAPGRSSEPKTT
jgi:hypothetical protein